MTRTTPSLTPPGQLPGSLPSERSSRLQSPRWQLAGAAVLFAVLTIAFFGPVVFSDKTLSIIAGHQSIQWPWAATPTGFADAPQSDQANYVYPLQVDLNRALRAGEFPFWSPDSFAGGPTLGTFYATGFYPPRLIASFVVPPILVHDLLLLLHTWLAGIGLYLLIRSLGGSWSAAVLAGVGWMFCPAWFGLAILEGSAVLAALLPLTLWLVHEAVVRHSYRFAAACGVMLALFVLGASVQPAVFCFAAVVLWGVAIGIDARHWRTYFRVMRRNAPIVAAAAAIGVALSAFILVPQAAQISDSARAEVPYAELVRGDVGLAELENVVDDDPPEPVTGDNVWTLTFVGLPVALLALVGTFTRRRGNGLGRSLVVVFALLMIGTPLTELAYELVPGFAYISPLGRILPFLALGVMILAALGLDATRDTLVRVVRPLSRALAAFGIVAAVLIAVEAWQTMRYSREANPPFQPREAAYLYPRTPMIDALSGTKQLLARSGDVARIIPVRSGAPGDPFFPPPLVGQVHQLAPVESIGGYMNVLPERSRILSNVLSGAPPAQARRPLVGAYMAFHYAAVTRFDLLERIGVNTLVAGPDPARDSRLAAALQRLDAQALHAGSDGTVFRLPETAPRAFVVDGVEVAPSEAAALERFTAPGFSYRTTVLFDGDDANDVPERRARTPIGADVRILPGERDERTIEVDSSRAGWLVVLDSWAQGWQAKVNGRGEAVRRADFAFRAVRIPAGKSRVEMRYRTPGLRLGLGISALGAVAVILLLIWPWVTNVVLRRGSTMHA